jgi:hypothetical protein
VGQVNGRRKTARDLDEPKRGSLTGSFRLGPRFTQISLKVDQPCGGYDQRHNQDHQKSGSFHKFLA